jgi:hypothetical protein
MTAWIARNYSVAILHREAGASPWLRSGGCLKRSGPPTGREHERVEKENYHGIDGPKRWRKKEEALLKSRSVAGPDSAYGSLLSALADMQRLSHRYVTPTINRLDSSQY